MGGIAIGTTEDDLRNYFQAYGKVCIVEEFLVTQRCIQSASLEALILLLDSDNIELRVPLDAEKKSNVYANYKL